MQKLSSIQMYIKQAACTVRRIDEKLTSEKLKVVRKNKKNKEKPDFFDLTERPWTNCHALRIKIKRTTSCSNCQ